MQVMRLKDEPQSPTQRGKQRGLSAMQLLPQQADGPVLHIPQTAQQRQNGGLARP